MVNLQHNSKVNLQIHLKKWPLHLFVDFILFSFLCLDWPCICALPACHFWGRLSSSSVVAGEENESCGEGYCVSPSTCCSVFHLKTVVRMQVSDLGSEWVSQICSNPRSDALQSSFSSPHLGLHTLFLWHKNAGYFLPFAQTVNLVFLGRCSALSICLAVGIIQNAGDTPPNSKVQAITQAEEGEIFLQSCAK